MNIANNTIRVDGRLVKMVYSKGKGEESSSSIQAKNRAPLVIQDAATIIKSKDLSLFVYDPTYGYYFHSGSGLYFNPNENYYWDSINQIQYKLDPISQEYLPPQSDTTNTTTNSTSADTTSSSATSQDNTSTSSDTKAENTSSSNSSSTNSALEAIQKSENTNKKDIGTSSGGITGTKKISITLPTKKVSKDIEKWGKKNKELVESIKAAPLELDLIPNKKKKSTTNTTNEDNSNTTGGESPTRSSNEGTDSSTSASGGGVSEKTDWTKYICDPELEQVVGNVCVLCKRQFGSTETLKKHQALSDLHKQNLEIARQKLNARIKDKIAHQDELNLNNNTSSSSSNSSSKSKTPKPEDFTVGVGGKLLEKMGWKKGEGIGKQNVVTSVIDVEIRPERAGLGSIDSGNHAVIAGDDWRTAVKKRARARVSYFIQFKTYI